MPNLVSAVPVVILAWVLASTSGLMRRVTRRAFAQRARDLIQRRQFRFAFDIELVDAGFQRRRAFPPRVLPTPENTILSAGMPAASALASSPPDTTSAPAPSFARVFSTARLPLALTEKATSEPVGSAPENTL